MKNTYIISGCSRGIGAAIARQCTGSDNYVIGLSRTEVPELSEFMASTSTHFRFIQTDLSKPNRVEQLSTELFSSLQREETSRLTLINNAGMLEPIAPCGSEQDDLVISHIQLNLIAPMLLSSAMIRFTKDWDIPKTILNISSGAATNPYYGWSSYCSSKAGLAMFTRCVALEQEEAEFPCKILAIAPGIVDTAMQDTIRTKRAEDFPMLEKFIQLKENGHLRDPAQVASDLLKLIHSSETKQGTLADLKSLV